MGFAVLAGLASLASVAAAQQQAVPLSVKKLSDDVYWTQGGAGGNTGIIIGKDGVIVVDAKTTADSAKQVLAEIAKLTPKPVTTVILTHSDGDHVNGLAAYPTGLTIIAQENCKKEIEATAGKPNASPQDHLPTKTVDKKESLTINGVKINLSHYAPAHTSGDLQVYLPAEKIAFAGDITATNNMYTRIHDEKNGTLAGWVQTMKGLIALNADHYVPGHGDLQTKDDLQKKLDLVTARRDEIAKLMKDGKSLDEIKKALNDPDPPQANPNAPVVNSFTTVVYNELKKKS
jgi:glyoxylase-like metal-dependent hydrolase (beta-lactamase superfamily II)